MSFVRYQPRPLAHRGIEVVAGYRLKVYSICYGEQPFERNRFAAGWDLARAALPQPSESSGRPGVGFVIMHQGRTGAYLILCWWDRENELPMRVFVHGQDGWRTAEASESICVWDIRVVWWEREAYVGTVLADRPDGVDSYLAAIVEGYA